MSATSDSQPTTSRVMDLPLEGPAADFGSAGPRESGVGTPARAALDALAREIFPNGQGRAVPVALGDAPPAPFLARSPGLADDEARVGLGPAPADGWSSAGAPARPADPRQVTARRRPARSAASALPVAEPREVTAEPDAGRAGSTSRRAPFPVPAPDASGRAGHVARSWGKTRFVYPVRRWPRRMLVLANVLVALTLLMAASAYAYANWRVGQIKRVDIPSLVGGTQAAGAAGSAVPAAAGAPMTILVVGSDSRAGNTGGDTAQFGSASDVAGQRSDTIMLVHLVPATRQAAILSIPRDLWVPIPGQGDSRINTAFDTGADLLVKAIETDLGIPIDHFVEVDFQSFRDIVNAVGGVKQYFPTPARDAYSLLNIPAAGCYNMTGDMALSFVRARHYEYQVDGSWQYEAQSDLARIERQQSFVKKMITKAEGENITNISAINGIIGGITTNLTLDSGFSQNLLLSLAERYRTLDSSTLPTSTLPTVPEVIGGADVLQLQQPDASQAIDNFLHPAAPATKAGNGSSTPSTVSTPSTTVPNIPPSSVQVAVRNGSGRSGEAASTASALSRRGFEVASVGSASSFTYSTSEVLYGPGNKAKAQLVASAVEGGAQIQSDPTVQGADVELITGQSFQGISTIPLAASSSPSTASNPTSTVPSATTTTIYQLPGTPAGSTPPSC
ncbi:MAG: LCP family protein [Acidimicrobiales bacterium]